MKVLLYLVELYGLGTSGSSLRPPVHGAGALDLSYRGSGLLPRRLTAHQVATLTRVELAIPCSTGRC